MQSQAVLVELEEFILREVGLSPKRQLHAANTMEDDLGMTRDDADEFMGAFPKRFNVAPSDFDFNRYFDMEGSSIWPFSILTNWLQRRWGITKYEHREALTVGMLQRAIDLGV